MNRQVTAQPFPATRESFSISAFASALLEPGPWHPPGLQVWNGSDPGVRLAVYRNNVVLSLVKALAETFPVVYQLIGEECFNATASVFVREQPPQSPIIAQYGEGFPDFLANFQPLCSLPYLADVARLEFFRVQAFHAADANTLNPEEFSARWADPGLWRTHSSAFIRRFGYFARRGRWPRFGAPISTSQTRRA